LEALDVDRAIISLCSLIDIFTRTITILRDVFKHESPVNMTYFLFCNDHIFFYTPSTILIK